MKWKNEILMPASKCLYFEDGMNSRFPKLGTGRTRPFMTLLCILASTMARNGCKWSKSEGLGDISLLVTAAFIAIPSFYHPHSKLDVRTCTTAIRLNTLQHA
jgi:hypothetical protein